MAADGLAHYVTRSSATVELNIEYNNIQYKQVVEILSC